MADALPDDVLQLIRRLLRSVGQLETLLFMFKNSDRAWSPTEVNDELRSSLTYVDQQLKDLLQRGIVIREADSRYRYAPTSNAAQLGETLQRLDELYRERRLTVMNEIYAQPNQAIQNFADSFKLKKDQK